MAIRTRPQRGRLQPEGKGVIHACVAAGAGDPGQRRRQCARGSPGLNEAGHTGSYQALSSGKAFEYFTLVRGTAIMGATASRHVA